MSIRDRTMDIPPTDPAERSDWVMRTLKRRHGPQMSLAEVGRRLDPPVTREAVRFALWMRSTRIQERLAELCGVAPQELWPERYPAIPQDSRGRPPGHCSAREAR